MRRANCGSQWHDVQGFARGRPWDAPVQGRSHDQNDKHCLARGTEARLRNRNRNRNRRRLEIPYSSSTA